MNKFKWFLILILFSVYSNAEITTSDLTKFNSLSDGQKAEVIKQIDVMSEGSSITPEVVQSKLKGWSEVGAGIGVMLVSTAKELGMAANEFSQTPLGKTAIVVGLFYMFGSKALGLLIWAVCWFFFLPWIWRSYKKHATREEIEKKLSDRKLFGYFPLYETKVTRRPLDASDSVVMMHVFVALGVFITGLVCVVNM